MMTAPHPLLAQLIDMLPPPGSNWTQKDRVAWYDTMVNALVLIYGAVDDDRAKIVVKPDVPEMLDPAPIGGQLEATPPKEPPAADTVPKVTHYRRHRPAPDGLNDGQERVWKALAGMISETGLTPTLKELAHRADCRIAHIDMRVLNLVAKGYVRMSGNRRSRLLHVVKWPDGVTPRNTVGRTDRPMPAARAPLAGLRKSGVGERLDDAVIDLLEKTPPAAPAPDAPAKSVRDNKPVKAEASAPGRCLTPGCKYMAVLGGLCSTCKAVTGFRTPLQHTRAKPEQIVDEEENEAPEDPETQGPSRYKRRCSSCPKIFETADLKQVNCGCSRRATA